MDVALQDLELQRLRTMSAADKLRRVEALFQDARALVEAGVRHRQPDLAGDALRTEVHRILTRVRR